jgi:hypothetical protein
VRLLMSLKGGFWSRIVPTGEAKVATVPDGDEPSLWEVLLMFALVVVVHVLAVCRVRNFWDVAAGWLDNQYYLHIATMIRTWRRPVEGVPHHFWGFSYAIAGVSGLLSISQLAALVTISMLASLAVCVLVHRLYGGWAATIFVFIQFEWIALSVEGGSEPLFVCLLYASFLAARAKRWNGAALLAALSTTVRPVGAFALLAFAVVLAMRKNYRQLASTTLIGLAIGALYAVPLWVLLGSPAANFIGYREDWGPQGWPLTGPFVRLIPSFFSAHPGMRWWRWPSCALWLALTLVGTVAMWLPRNRLRFWRYQHEILFASIYSLFFVSYNYPGIVGDLPRFLIPVLPFVLFSLRDWTPRDRRVLWGAAVLSALLASAHMVGFRNVFGFRLP